MSRKAKPFVAIAVALYLFLMWSAYRWGDSQRFLDGDLFQHMDNERKKKAALEEKPDIPISTPASRLNAGGPTFVAVRYDATRVVFMVATDTEPSFAESRFGKPSATLQKIAASSKPSAQLAGLQELWEPEGGSVHRLPENVNNTAKGEQWMLDISRTSSVPVLIDRQIIAPTGCNLGAGFLLHVHRPPPGPAKNLAAP